MHGDEIRDVLTEIGYVLHDYGKHFRSRPLYRESDNNTVLSIDKENGRWRDFKTNQGGSLEDLIKITLNLKDFSTAKQYLSGKVSVDNEQRPKPLVKSPKIFPHELLAKIDKDDSYWNGRGITSDTLKLFSGGLVKSGKMKNRYVFPVFDSIENIIGFSGRYIYHIKDGYNIPKWKHIGDKKEWKYPLQVNFDILKNNKKTILIESIGDMLSLWEAGIKNTIVIFGLNVSQTVILTLLSIDPDEIILSLNNDSSNNFAGNTAAKKAKEKLSKHFDCNQVRIALPNKKDFGEMSPQEVLTWREEFNI